MKHIFPLFILIFILSACEEEKDSIAVANQVGRWSGEVRTELYADGVLVSDENKEYFQIKLNKNNSGTISYTTQQGHFLFDRDIQWYTYNSGRTFRIVVDDTRIPRNDYQIVLDESNQQEYEREAARLTNLGVLEITMERWKMTKSN